MKNPNTQTSFCPNWAMPALLSAFFMCFAACEKPDADRVTPLQQSVSRSQATIIDTPRSQPSTALVAPNERKKQNIGLITIDVRIGE